ncbi:ctr copper transporter family domain-containing protein [Ditylenchus destructor]|uniref:Copper transport protein n=1 Tax=Ditylenchus destructor TaxID=166010 RepID=A0AAD4N1H7_9BILA|nr:ctr copper transporter family domain-containing protein [Ditylenchus destructor]
MPMKMPMMTMYFHWRLEEIILFKEWCTDTSTGFAFSCVAVLSLSLLYELLRGSRAYYDEIFHRRKPCCEADIYYYTSSGPHIVPHSQIPSTSNVTSTAVANPSVVCECETPKPEQREKDPLKRPKEIPTKFQRQVYGGVQSLLYFVQISWSFCLMLIAMSFNWAVFGSLVLGHTIGYYLSGPMFFSVEAELRVGDCCCA